MKAIVAGSRHGLTYNDVKSAILSSPFYHLITEIVSGRASGVDLFGERFAKEYGLKLTTFPADWFTYGKSAGYYRNRQMAEYSDALIAVWNNVSNGTLNMVSLAKQLNLPIYIKTIYRIPNKELPNQMKNSRQHFRAVLHSSLTPFVNSSPADFPASDRRIGVIARSGVHPVYNRTMVEVEAEIPSFVSSCRGEYVEVEEGDGTIRARLLENAAACRDIAKELIEHAERMESRAMEDVVMDDVPDYVAGDVDREDRPVDVPSFSRGVTKIPQTQKSSSISKVSPKVTSRPVDISDL